MTDEKKINGWRNRAVKKGDTPIALVCVDKDGFPIVYTDHSSKTMGDVWKHLASAPMLGESTHFEGQEN